MNLKPCPFCGGALRMVLEPADRTYDCTECDTTIHVGFKNPQRFINSRPIEDAQAKRIEELEGLVADVIHYDVDDTLHNRLVKALEVKQ